MNAKAAGLALGLVLAAATAVGCGDDKPQVPLAETATSLGSAKPAAANAIKLSIDKGSSKVDFTMEAPVEKIRGKVWGALEGDLNVDPADLTKTTGKIMVNLSGLELFQRVKKDDKDEFGEEQKQEKQNEHARQWLEISPDAPEKDRKTYEVVEFQLTKVEKVSEASLLKMTGAERKVTMTLAGDLLLHGRKSQKTVTIEATFQFEGDKPKGVTVKTTAPFPAGLAEHDVRPRTGFGVLAEKTLDALGSKVAKEAQVSVEFSAKM